MTELDEQRARLLRVMALRFLVRYMVAHYEGRGFGRLFDEHPNFGGAFVRVGDQD